MALLNNSPDRLAGFSLAHRYVPSGVTYIFEKHEPVLDGFVGSGAFLVPAHGEEYLLNVDIGHAAGQAGGPNQVLVHAGQVPAEPLAREVRGGDHPGRDSRAVGQIVVCCCLEGVADGVAVVQDGAQSSFQLVFGDYVSFEADRVEDEPLQRVEVARTGGPDQVEVGVKVSSREQAHLDRLGKAVGDLTLRQRGEPVQVRRHQAGPDEGADQVLTLGEIHPDLAADGAVHHGKK